MKHASILLVEDEALIRMMLVDMVEQLGHTVIAEAGSVDLGRSLAEIEDYDCAILDINLHGFNVRPVAEAVTGRGLPLVFVSGYGTKGVPDGFQGMPVLNKPCSQEALKRTIDAVLSDAQHEKIRDIGDEGS
ncbi:MULTISPECIES: response regulator [unclassified Bradyrhizobium]|uniref:response regulator n=1 Tax=unclassified Bradyrhizobium TaxID=2631580 RepID=UPI0020B2C7C8|nr:MULTISPECIES: response regulator [unclassified Bradyrhizobium]MCP3401868.1 response regulator [Bradyrhizobium sp. CCGB20]MCP3407615.1 response regulator [Bradyrhizobium sp. CCGB01]MCP3410353.1 response regulator [Bradyrhizobium sp. CCGB01]